MLKQQFQNALLWVQIPDNVLGKATDDSSSTLVLDMHMENPDGVMGFG